MMFNTLVLTNPMPSNKPLINNSIFVNFKYYNCNMAYTDPTCTSEFVMNKVFKLNTLSVIPIWYSGSSRNKIPEFSGKKE